MSKRWFLILMPMSGSCMLTIIRSICPASIGHAQPCGWWQGVRGQPDSPVQAGSREAAWHHAARGTPCSQPRCGERCRRVSPGHRGAPFLGSEPCGGCGTPGAGGQARSSGAHP